jgi:hypothetical protein
MEDFEQRLVKVNADEETSMQDYLDAEAKHYHANKHNAKNKKYMGKLRYASEKVCVECATRITGLYKDR